MKELIKSTSNVINFVNSVYTLYTAVPCGGAAGTSWNWSELAGTGCAGQGAGPASPHSAADPGAPTARQGAAALLFKNSEKLATNGS